MKPTIICDPGSNWVGNMNLLKEIAKEVKRSDENCCLKPQLYDISLYSKEGNPYYDLQQRCSMSFEQAKEIYMYCDRLNFGCFFSCFDLERLGWIHRMGIKSVKVAARMAGNNEFLTKIKEYDMYPIITISDTFPHFAIEQYKEKFEGDVGFLYGVNKYPALIRDYDLCKVVELKGVSDHTNNIYLALASVIGGAKIVEKHVYYTNVNTPDILSSINFTQLRHLVEEYEILERLGEL